MNRIEFISLMNKKQKGRSHARQIQLGERNPVNYEKEKGYIVVARDWGNGR